MWVKTIATDKVFVLFWGVCSLKKMHLLAQRQSEITFSPFSPFSVPPYAPEVLIRIPPTSTSDLSICFVSTSAMIVTRTVGLFS